VNLPVQVHYRGVSRNLRPPRAMTLIGSSGDWRADALRMMECYSRTWGGDGNGLVACSNDWEIAEPFWSLLTAFDADHWAVFRRTRRGLQMADPVAYQATLDAEVASWTAQYGGSEADARQMFEAEQFLSQPLGGWPVQDELDERVRKRLAPLASAGATVDGIYQADEAPSGRLVDMCQLTFRPDRVNVLDVANLPLSVQLLVAARTGNLSPSHRAQLEEGGKEVLRASQVADDELPALLEFAWTGTVNRAFQQVRDRLSGADGESPGPEFASHDYFADTPLAQSRLGCHWLTKWRPGICQGG